MTKLVWRGSPAPAGNSPESEPCEPWHMIPAICRGFDPHHLAGSHARDANLNGRPPETCPGLPLLDFGPSKFITPVKKAVGKIINLKFYTSSIEYSSTFDAATSKLVPRNILD